MSDTNSVPEKATAFLYRSNKWLDNRAIKVTIYRTTRLHRKSLCWQTSGVPKRSVSWFSEPASEVPQSKCRYGRK